MLTKTALAQDSLLLPDSLLLTPPQRSYLKISAGYLSNAVYNGRKDSVTIPYITGTVGYYHKSGLSLSGSFSYQTNTNIIDVFSLDAGYSIDISDKLSLGFSADKPFYNNSSTAVQSSIKGSLGTNVVYTTSIISVEADVSAAFSDKTDILATGILSHQFLIANRNSSSGITITPSLSANFGTQNFYQSYLERTAKKRNISVTSSSVSGSNSFGLLDNELSLPLGFDAKKWGFTLVPTYAIPQNPIITTTTNTISILTKTFNVTTKDTEKLQNAFYVQIALYLKF